MKDQIEVMKRTESQLAVRVRSPQLLDLSMTSRILQDENCLPCHTKPDGTIDYDLTGMVSLQDFLQQYEFEGKEGYSFLEQLLDRAIVCGRGKPVVLDNEFIFTTCTGDRFCFAALPLTTEAWLLQKEPARKWIRQLIRQFRTRTCYEIQGFLGALCESDDFSLPAAVSGIRDLKYQYYPRRFRFLPERPALPFQARKAVQIPAMHFVMEETSVPLMETEKTLVLIEPEPARACLRRGEEEYPLPFELMLVGRGMQCDIRLPDMDVSVRHAKIVCSQDRYYITDLHSSNGTFLNEKQVSRRMRLKDGMKVRFGQAEFTFCQ